MLIPFNMGLTDNYELIHAVKMISFMVTTIKQVLTK